jgi:hypothetical protein
MSIEFSGQRKAMQPAVIPFQISISGQSTSGYLLRAGAAGRTQEVPLVPPDPINDTPALGKALGTALFPKPVRQMLIDVARGADESGARLQIQLYVAPPELAILPWEWMTLGDQTLWQPALRDDYAMIRVRRRAPQRPNLVVNGPLRLLIIAAPGADDRIGPLSKPLSAVAQSNGIIVDLLRDATPAAIAAALEEEPSHILHVLAPISSGIRGETRLRLGRGIEAQTLIELLQPHADLRLITFAGGDAIACDSLSGIVHERTGIATISLDGQHDDQYAAFAATCYATLADGQPVDLAVTDGRAVLAEQNGNWGIPRLYLRPGCEQLFTINPAPAERDVVRVGQPIPRPMNERRQNQDVRTKPRPARFDVADTAVGAPARRVFEAARKAHLLRPQVIALVIASLILAIMVYANLERPEPPAAPVPTPALLPPTIAPLPTLIPTISGN